VKCWGNNQVGQLGNGTFTEVGPPADVIGLSGEVKTISAGSIHTCALLTSSAVKCWGANYHGALGDGTTEHQASPADVIGLSSGVIAIDAGEMYTCVLLENGGVKCWGRNQYGQLGDGTTTERTSPVEVIGLSSGVAAISAGGGSGTGSHTCALLSSGGVKCWGSNDGGQLGDGTTENRYAPVDVVGLDGDAVGIMTGPNHTCARLSSGKVQCWGDNRFAELGDGTLVNKNVPVTISGLSGAVQVTGGASHGCALMAFGEVKCWGFNPYGQLGNAIAANRLTATDVSGLSSGVDEISAGESYTCALLSSNEAKCWGTNSYGQLGDGTTYPRQTPEEVSILSTDIAAISVSRMTHDSHTCALLASGGVKCWGYNSKGQLGDGTTENRITPVSVSGLESGVAAIAVGDNYTCALLASGGMKCWGVNTFGELGDGTTEDKSTPVDVYGLSSGVAEIAAGSHTCARLSSGGMKCWGRNAYGQLGDGTTVIRHTPVDVIGVSSDVVAISVGSAYTCALFSSGGVKCWGYNSRGQLGDGTTTNRDTPVHPIGLSIGVAEFSAGPGHSCAILLSGELKCWGWNGYGQLGDGTMTDRYEPVVVSGLSNDVKAISAGALHTCALLFSGGVKCWGSNGNGQIGDGSAWSTTPVSVVWP